VNILLGIESDPLGIGYNVAQSKIAIGSGGLTGKGFLQGTQTKFDFVPEQSTDFIFCTVGEEWGFLGTSIVILLFSYLLIRLIQLAERQRSDFSRIYGYGVVAILFFHFAINIGMTIGLMPVIGIPLPFFSYGGSSLWAFTILLFIFLRLDASRMELLR
jgi:rod shape determining protein RodA